jgi:glycosyltransferase involved in cell wall biosynthesis
VAVPDRVEKAQEPTVCYNGRWDRRKRPELFFELARAFPDVRFVAMGGSRDGAWEARLRSRYGHLPNLELAGLIDQFLEPDRWARILERSWVLVSTATREGLPNAFLEAAAHGCAILSAVDPDEFASRFGYYAEDEDFEAGLHHLLEQDRWRCHGERARRHVRDYFETTTAVDRHLEAYARALAS